MHLAAFMRSASIHAGAWRYPGAWPDANFNFAHMRELIAKLEAARFDAFFMADHLAVLNMPIAALKRSHTVGAGGGDGEDRPGRHRLDRLRFALSRGPQVRLARPHQRRARGGGTSSDVTTLHGSEACGANGCTCSSTETPVFAWSAS